MMVTHAIDRNKVLACNEESISGYFKRLYNVIHRYDIGSVDCWNFDEKGFTMS
jgi:hypothetical protein